MNFNFLIELLFVLAAVAILWWGIARMGVPEPIKTIVLVLVSLVVLFWLYSAFAGGVFHMGRFGH